MWLRYSIETLKNYTKIQNIIKQGVRPNVYKRVEEHILQLELEY